MKRHCGGLDHERDVKADGRSFPSVFAHGALPVGKFRPLFPFSPSGHVVTSSVRRDDARGGLRHRKLRDCLVFSASLV